MSKTAEKSKKQKYAVLKLCKQYIEVHGSANSTELLAFVNEHLSKMYKVNPTKLALFLRGCTEIKKERDGKNIVYKLKYHTNNKYMVEFYIVRKWNGSEGIIVECPKCGRYGHLKYVKIASFGKYRFHVIHDEQICNFKISDGYQFDILREIIEFYRDKNKNTVINPCRKTCDMCHKSKKIPRKDKILFCGTSSRYGIEVQSKVYKEKKIYDEKYKDERCKHAVY